jgi:hypothetical protein
MLGKTIRVRPLGKYGHLYELDRHLSCLYLAYTVLFYVLLAFILLVFFISTDICIGFLEGLCHLPPVLILIMALLGIVGKLKIASLGTNISTKRDSESTFEKSKISIYVRRGYFLAGGTSTLALAIWIMLSIQTRLLTHTPIPAYGFFLLVLLLCASFYYFKKLIS